MAKLIQLQIEVVKHNLMEEMEKKDRALRLCVDNRHAAAM